MKSFSFLFFIIVLGALAGFISVSNAKAHDDIKNIENLLTELAIEQGKGRFTQKKHFSFMSVPIESSGLFIVKSQSALWQTEQPVFSALLLKPKAIYRRTSLQQGFELLTDSAEFSTVLSTLFTGKVDNESWFIALKETTEPDTKAACLTLTPKTKQLSQLFKQVDLCLPETEKHQRKLILLDQQDNKTEIVMRLSDDLFIPRDYQALETPTLKVNSQGSELTNES